MHKNRNIYKKTYVFFNYQVSFVDVYNYFYPEGNNVSAKVLNYIAYGFTK